MKLRLVVIGFLAHAVLVGAEEPQFDVSQMTMPAGQILLFCERVEAADGSDIQTWYLVDPEQENAPQALVRHRQESGSVPRVHLRMRARIGRSRLLAQHTDDLVVIDLAKGIITTLIDDRLHRLIDVGSDRAICLIFDEADDIRHGRWRLETDPISGESRVADHDRSTAILTGVTLDDPFTVTAISELPVRQLLQTTAEGFLVVVRRDAVESLWRIDADGNETEIAACPEGLIGMESVLSADRSLLAMSYLSAKHGFFTQRGLWVVELESGETRYLAPTLPVHHEPTDSFPPRLQINWEDDHWLAVGGAEPFMIDFSLSQTPPTRVRGVFSAEAPWTDFAPEEERWRRGRFEGTWREIFFAGDVEPIATLYASNVGTRRAVISPDGRFAAYCDPRSNVVHLADGELRSIRVAYRNWSYDLQWLPATDGAQGVGR